MVSYDITVVKQVAGLIQKGQHSLGIWKKHSIIIGLSFIVLFVAMVYRQSLYGIFGEQNYLTIHLIMEIFIITLGFSIAIQSWTVFPHSLSRYRIWIGALFFVVSMLELIHTISFKGMPHFLSESSAYKATWLFMATRLTEVLGMLCIVASRDRLVPPNRRLIAYSIAFIYISAWIFIVFYPTTLLPELVVEGIGTTALKNNLQYAGILIEFLVILIVVFRFRTMEVFNSMLIVASVYLIISDFYFTTYKSVFDINNFMGHIFQIAAYYFLQRAVYHSAVEEPFQKQMEAEMRLKQNEKYLQTITSHMGEGLIVMDIKGNVTYMNLEAERLIGWSQEQLVGKNFHENVHQRLNGGNDLFCKYPNKNLINDMEITQEKDDYFKRKNGSVFPASYVVTPFTERGQVSGSIMVFRDITQQKKDQELIQYMAFYDELTKLPNLRYVKDKMTGMVDKTNKTSKTAILILDIDRFKKINEALGHSIGDTILQATASRLKKFLTSNMILVRLTGDEFALIQYSIKREEEILETVEKIQEAFKQPLEAKHLLVNISMSMGVAIYPDHGKELEELLQHSNMALTEAQQNNTPMKFYHPAMNGKALDTLVLENDLFHALSNNELYLVYQPQINIETGNIIGVEALLRWNHPEHGLISPAKFIPIAEDTGMIIPIGEWVLRTACRQLKEWYNQGIPPIMMAVNLSIRQFYQQNLVEMVTGILGETKLSPQYLELEITESMMMNKEHTQKTLISLKKLGIQIAIDDFGTGYSSLSYLKHLPFDRLKIDQSFVHDLQNDETDTTIVSTIISMAHHFNFNVIAEGVETEKQKEILYNHHCNLIQGNLFSPPLLPKEVIKKMKGIEEKAGRKKDGDSKVS
jgi:diguanylate cyclase (GGDEF)-like protein/PAS domain S-box-containing protein